jgi:hypothetical protein
VVLHSITSIILPAVGIRTYMPNFVRVDSSDLDENVRRIKAANVQFPMGKFTKLFLFFYLFGGGLILQRFIFSLPRVMYIVPLAWEIIVTTPSVNDFKKIIP